MTLPNAEDQIQTALAGQSTDIPWEKGLKLVMDAEKDSEAAVEAIEKLKAEYSQPRLII